jgi:predicted MFS family arabinose efflux permease
MTAGLADPIIRRDFQTIVLVSLAHGTSHFYHLVLPSLFPWLMRELACSFTQVGALMTVFFLISSIGQALAGFAVDRFGAQRVLLFGVGVLALAGLALGSAQSYTMLVVAAVIAGIGNSVFHPADFTVLNRCVSEPRLGHAFSIHGLAGNLGWAAAPVTVVGIASTAGWRIAAVATGVIGIGVLALLIWQRTTLTFPGDGISRAARTPASPASTSLSFLSIPAIWLCLAFFFLTTMAAGALQAFAPVTLQNLYGLSLRGASSTLSVYLVAGACGMVVGGFLAGRHESHDHIIMGALALAAVMTLVLAGVMLPGWSVAGLMATMGFGVGIAGPSRDLLVRAVATGVLELAAFGRVYGFVYSGLDIGLASAPLVFGPLMDRGQFAIVLGGVAVLQCMAIATVMIVGARARGHCQVVGDDMVTRQQQVLSGRDCHRPDA